MDSSYNASYGVADGQASGRGQSATQNRLYNSYRAVAPSAIDPALQDHRPALNNANLQMRIEASASPPLHRQEGIRNLHTSPRGMLLNTQHGGMIRSANSMSPPLVDTVSHRRHQSLESQRPDQRSLPSREVADETIDDAYVAFILYSNPSVPSSADTGDLRRIFRAPPRSDGKSFRIYTLWELIRKLENKELKTWTQLAIELGVEPPSAEKHQSAQKVQQYAVRLKRWMHAMHVDAFFEFLLGKPHTYYTQLPLNTQGPEQGRDGVPLEEDLALRALVPEWKPKRGRKKAEDKENDPEKETRPAKRPHLDTSAAVVEYDGFGGHSALFPQSAIPWSAFPDDVEHHDPWAAASAITTGPTATTQTLTPHPFSGRNGQEFRWRMSGRDVSPSGPYPQSAITPRVRHTDNLADAEPQSAVTPSSSGAKGRARRRHGPAVSSAWPSSGNPSTGKLRGRPPSNRSTQDGPFSTFPANPKSNDTPTVHLSSSILMSTPITDSNQQIALSSGPSLSMQGDPPPFQQLNARPSKLQLQVPQHSGGPVRLATPPTVLVNGESDGPASPLFGTHGRRTSADFFNDPEDNENITAPSEQVRQNQNTSPDISIDDVSRAFATRLLRGKLINRQAALGLAEARAIADKAIIQIQEKNRGGIPYDVFVIKCAAILGVSQDLGLGGEPPSTITIKAIQNGSGTPRTPKSRHTAAKNGLPKSAQTAEFIISYDLVTGSSFSTSAQIRNLSLPQTQSHDLDEKEIEKLRNALKSFNSVAVGNDELGDDDFDAGIASDATWKQRFLNLQTRFKKQDRTLRRYKRRLLEAVMADEDN